MWFYHFESCTHGSARRKPYKVSTALSVWLFFHPQLFFNQEIPSPLHHFFGLQTEKRLVIFVWKLMKNLFMMILILTLSQRCAKLYILSRNRNQYAIGSRFRTTKSKPICIDGFFRNQNRNQCPNFEQIRNQNQNQFAWAAIFKTKTTTNYDFWSILFK